MEITTSKIQEIKSVKPHNGAHGTIFYHHLVMDNGDKIDIGKKSECKIGWELTYEIIGDPSQQEFTKAKAAQKEGGFTPTTSVAGSKSTQSASFALSYAKDLVVADKIKIDDILKTADKFNLWLKSN